MPTPSPISGNPRFYRRCGPFSLSQIAQALGEPIVDDRVIEGLAPLHAAGPHQISFVNGPRNRAALHGTAAGAVIVPPGLLADVPATAIAIPCRSPEHAWAQVAALFHPVPPTAPGIHPLACVDPAATVDPTAEIGPFACVEAGAEIGPACRIAAHAQIGPGVRLGPHCRIGAGATLSHAELGARVIVFPGVRIGQEGFGFAWTGAAYETAPQIGRVLIGDDVEIGANTTIDRGSIEDTVIGAGTRIDNLVQIAHNVRIGRFCVIVAQVGIAGSSVLEDFVQLGGQVAVAPHLHIGAGAKVGAQAGLIADVPPGAILLGSPAQPRKDFFRQVAILRRLARPARPSPSDTEPTA